MTNFTIFRNFSFSCPVVCAALSFFAVYPQLCEGQAPQQVQIPNSTDLNFLRNKLEKANGRISAIDVVWNRTQSIKPIVQVNPDEWAARSLAQSREQGLNEAQAQAVATVSRREGFRSKQEQIINSTVEFTRVGTTVLSRINYPDKIYQSRKIEFSDGVNALSAETHIDGKEIKIKKGIVVQGHKQAFRLSAGYSDMIKVLLGFPFNQGLTPANPALTEKNSFLRLSPTKSIVIESETQTENGTTKRPEDLIFSGDSFSLTSLKIFDVIAQMQSNKTLVFEKGGLNTSVVVSGYKDYSNGIRFPSKVVMTTSTSTTEYTLVSAKFNSEVDPSDLRLPAGLRVADTRFGEGANAANYTVKDGKLPSDAEVKAIIERDAKAVQAKEEQAHAGATKTTLSSSLAPLGGLSLIALGGFMLLRNKRKKG